MDDLQLIAAFAPQGPPDASERHGALARLDERMAGMRRAAPVVTGVRRRAVGLSVAAVLAAAAAGVTAVVVSGGGPGVVSAYAAVNAAAAVTAESARESGTAVVRMTHGGEIWAGTTVVWNDGDLSVATDAPTAVRGRQETRVVDGRTYSVMPRILGGGWVDMGPAPYGGVDELSDRFVVPTQEDLFGITLSRLTGGMTGLTTERADDGSTVYRGSVAAGLVARETGFKEGQALRVLPFGYVAHGEAEDPAAPLGAALTVGADGLVRRIAVEWGAGASAWAYTVEYDDLGAAPAITAPVDAEPFRPRRP